MNTGISSFILPILPALTVFEQLVDDTDFNESFIHFYYISQPMR